MEDDENMKKVVRFPLENAEQNISDVPFIYSDVNTRQARADG